MRLPLDPAALQEQAGQLTLDAVVSAAREVQDLKQFSDLFKKKTSKAVNALFVENENLSLGFNTNLAQELQKAATADQNHILSSLHSFQKCASSATAATVLINHLIPHFVNLIKKEKSAEEQNLEDNMYKTELENSELKGKIDELHKQLDEALRRRSEKKESAVKVAPVSLGPIEDSLKKIEKNLAAFDQKITDIQVLSKEKNSEAQEKQMRSLHGQFLASLQDFLGRFREELGAERDGQRNLQLEIEENRREIAELRGENDRLNGIRQDQMLVLVKKEAEVKLLQEKIRSDERLRQNQMEFSSMLCNVG